MAYFFASIANGLGDLVVSLPALQSLIATGKPTFLVLRSPNQFGLCDRIDGLAGSLREIDFSSGELNENDVFINLRAHPLQSDHVWGSEEFDAKYPGYKINDVLEGICRDWKIGADFAYLRPLRFETIDRLHKTITFIPGSVGAVKCWPAKHWIELAYHLSGSGLEAVVVGQPERSHVVKELVDSGLAHVATPTLAEALDVISSSLAVVAVDTGLMHLAVTQQIPTVSLFRYNTMFYRPYAHTEALVAPLCPSACRVREYSEVPNKMLSYDVWSTDSYTYWKTWECAEAADKHCMVSITPEQVAASVVRLIAMKG